MRKTSDFLGKDLISADDGTVLGKISGLSCEMRIKALNFFTVFDENAENERFFAVAPRNLKQKSDKCIILSNILCIKNSADLDNANCITVEIGCGVCDQNGADCGRLQDIYFGETSKSVEGLLVDGQIIPPCSVESVTDGKIILLPEGRKRRSANKIVKPADDYQVSVLPMPVTPEFEEFALAETPPAEKAEIPAETPPKTSYMPNKFIGNYRFLLGRVVTCNMYNVRRELIIKAGTLVTADVVLLAHKNNKLVELTVNSKA